MIQPNDIIFNGNQNIVIIRKYDDGTYKYLTTSAFNNVQIFDESPKFENRHDCIASLLKYIFNKMTFDDCEELIADWTAINGAINEFIYFALGFAIADKNN